MHPLYAMRKKLLLAIIFVLPILGFAQESKTVLECLKLHIGDRYAELVLPNENEENIKLSDYCGKGNYTLLIFEEPAFCSIVHKDIPILKDLYNTYHPKGVEFVGINAAWAPSVLKKFINKFKIPWPQMGDFNYVPYREKLFCPDTYGVKAYPIYYLVNPEGIIVSLQVGSISSVPTVHYKLIQIFNIMDDGGVVPNSRAEEIQCWGYRDPVSDHTTTVVDINYHNGNRSFTTYDSFFTSDKNLPDCKSSEIVNERTINGKLILTVRSEFDLRKKLQNKNHNYYIRTRGRYANSGFPKTGDFKYHYWRLYTTYSITVKDNLPIVRIEEKKISYYYDGICTYAETRSNIDKEYPLFPY